MTESPAAPSDVPPGASTGSGAYAAAGVSIEAADRAIDLMKGWVEKARRPEMIGGLGGFVLPLLFGWLKDQTGSWSSCFAVLFVLVAGCTLWMHLSIRQSRTAPQPA